MAICISFRVLICSSYYKSLISIRSCGTDLLLFLGGSLLMRSLDFAISSLLELVLVVIVQLIENIVVQVFGFCGR